jgi:hypothetical protein
LLQDSSFKFTLNKNQFLDEIVVQCSIVQFTEGYNQTKPRN